jgi:hypothetical protein
MGGGLAMDGLILNLLFFGLGTLFGVVLFASAREGK